MITVVTGNPNKMKEIKVLAPPDMEFSAREIDLDEIQSLDLQKIVEDKVKRAYEIVKSAVIIEDVSAGLDDLAGLPGPFYKFFRKELGDTILVKLAKISSDKVTIRCLAAYYDGSNLIVGEGLIRGKVVEPRGTNGFGFDPVVIPDGQTRTMAEMTPEEKRKISHRGKAYHNLFEQIKILKTY